jgi:hypothetical protein
LHLHLNLGRRLHRFASTNVARLSTLFAAFLGALSMALTLYLQVNARIISSQAPLFSWAGNLILFGALLGGGAVPLGGIPLIIAAWRSTPRSRFLFLVPFPALVLTFAVVALGTYIPDPAVRSAMLAAPLYALPFICILAITYALRQAAIADKWLRFANRLSSLVVLGMLLMLIGILLWGFALALFAPGWFFALLPLFTFPWNSWLLIALGMLIAFLIAVFAFFAQNRARIRPAPRQEPPGTWD